jgi:phosphate transport system substrate-binding protein
MASAGVAMVLVALTTVFVTPVTAAEELKGTVKIDGSSTVFPFGEAAADLFGEEFPSVQVTVGESGTGGGFKKFCAGEIDLAAASREIKDDEIAACKTKGISFKQLTIANDGIAMVVNPSNKAVNCLTVAQLKKIWDQGSTVKNWKTVDPKFGDLPLKLFGAGTASGTFDFFTEAVNGKAKRSRADYNATEDDNVTVRGVSGTKGGLGYFGLSYAELNKKKVKVLGVDAGNGKCVKPSVKTVQDGTYRPLSRPLFFYASAKSLKQPQVLAFAEYIMENLDVLAQEALFVPLTKAQQAIAKATLAELKAME